MNEQIFIKGTAITEGVSRNNILYSAAELSKFAPTLKGKPILKDHDSRTDNTIGKVTNTGTINNGAIITYEGWIKEDGSGIIEKIKDGRINEVSIGAIAKRMVREKDSDILIAEDIHALELSTTPTPGVVGTSIGITQKAKVNISKNNLESTSERRLGEKLVDKQEENNEVKELISERTKLAEEISTLKESIRQGKINEYKKLCVEKKVKELDMTKTSIEVIEFALKQLELIEVVIPQVVTPKAELKSEVTEKKEVSKSGLVIERSIDGSGHAIWEMPDRKKWSKLHNDPKGLLKEW